jgi:hypothetical protein
MTSTLGLAGRPAHSAPDELRHPVDDPVDGGQLGVDLLDRVAASPRARRRLGNRTPTLSASTEYGCAVVREWPWPSVLWEE